LRSQRATLVSVTLASVALGCAAPAPAGRGAQELAPRADAFAGYRYRVAVGPRGDELGVEVDLPRGPAAPQRWGTETPVLPFVRDVGIAGDGGFQTVPLADGGWLVPGCAAARGCTLRYRVLLASAARALDDFNFAQDHRGALLAPPSSWLVRPLAVHAPFQLAVSTAPGVGFTTGLARAAANAELFVGDVGNLDDTPYAAFGPLTLTTRRFADRALDVALTPGPIEPATRKAMDAWIDGAGAAMTAYYGRFPIPRASLIVMVGEGTGVGDGHTMGNGGGAVLVSVGDRTPAADFADDWMLVHEMVHLSFPDVNRPWAEEGLATYLEPIIRVRAGLFTADALWRSLIEGLPQGQPEAGDGGLDVTDNWGRRYWGGAIFWLVGDVEIRKRTENRRSLDDALRAVNRAGGDVSVRWDLDRVLAMADEAVGAPVLVPLRRTLGGAPGRVDLDALWRGLGVSLAGRRVVYDDAAPLAAIRRAITRPPPP
jgi:hypothetical protein